MDINRNNYQVWISNFYEDSLSESEMVLLHNFLDLNPDLKDEFDAFRELVLHPDISIRLDKSTLRKDITDLEDEELEKYAIALAEKDLSAEDSIEISSLLEQSTKAQSLVDQFKLIKLVPEDTIYPEKLRLKRIPYRLVGFRIILRTVAAAAAVAIIISVSTLMTGNHYPLTEYNSAYLLPFNPGEPESEMSDTRDLTPVLTKTRIPLKEIRLKERPANISETIIEAERVTIAVNKTRHLNEISLASGVLADNLATMVPTEVIPADYISDDLSPRQFVAKNFRRHLLKEDVDNTGRLKAYEVADASISGLNKILGWEMQFEKEKTEDGKLSSFSFTSQLLNFDHKKKKITDQP